MDDFRRKGLKGRLRLNARRKRKGPKKGSGPKSKEFCLQQGTSNVENVNGSGEINFPATIPPENILNLSREDSSDFTQIEKEGFTNVSTVNNAPDQKNSPEPGNQDNICLEGRRLTDIQYFLDCLKEISGHNSIFDCNLSHLNVIKERIDGFISKITFKCSMCNDVFEIATSCSNPNEDAVIGMMVAGVGYAALSQIAACLDIPCQTSKSYRRHENKLSNAWEDISLKSMQEAGATERQLALAEGNIANDGTPMITVVADGSWAKRSYKSTYNSLSGAAAIIGYRTKQVLFIGVKNKYCTICKLAQSREENPKEHKCYKNFIGPSTSMEGDILREGFLCSIQQHGLIYNKLIADGDSNCFKKIVDSHPYDNVSVKKVECRNHLLRNYSRKIRDLAKDKYSGPLILRKHIDKGQLRLRYAITKAIEYRKKETGTIEEKAKLLEMDMENSLSHVFGEHKYCQKIGYFCNEDFQPTDNVLADLKQTDLYEKLRGFLQHLIRNSISLIQDVDNNVVEQFNSIIAKFIGGKRVNYCQRGSYQTRVNAAVVAHNTRRPIYLIKKKLNNEKSPSNFCKKIEVKKKYSSKIKPRKLTFEPKKGKDENYGDACQKPDMETEQYELEKEKFLANLEISNEEIKKIEEITRNQSECDLWHLERRKRITASHFGSVCAKFSIRSHGNTHNLVDSILYPKAIATKSIEWGKSHEKDALIELQKVIGKKIVPCGLFIDQTNQFLAATPDGLLEEEGLVEIKCPYSAKDITPEEAIASRKVTFWKKNGEINRNNKWFYQIQGQMMVTRRKYCCFAIWTPLGIKYEIILKDEEFCKSMRKKLYDFYMTCCLPELIDPRKIRNMTIRRTSVKKENKNPSPPPK